MPGTLQTPSERPARVTDSVTGSAQAAVRVPSQEAFSS